MKPLRGYVKYKQGSVWLIKAESIGEVEIPIVEWPNLKAGMRVWLGYSFKQMKVVTILIDIHEEPPEFDGADYNEDEAM